MPGSAVLVNMAEDMKAWLNLPDGLEEFLAARSDSRLGLITKSARRRVRDKDIDVPRNLIPFLRQGPSPWQKKDPRIVIRLPWAAPEHQAIDRHAFVFKIGDPGSEQPQGFFTLIGEAPIMIARSEDLVGMRLAAKPISEPLKLVQIAFPSQITRMDQNITGGKNTKIVVISMRVGNRNNSHLYSLLIPSPLLILLIIVCADLNLRSSWPRPRGRRGLNCHKGCGWEHGRS